LSRQWRDNLVTSVGFVKLPHPKQVCPGKPSKSGMSSGDVSGKLIYYAVTPLGGFDLTADNLPDVPIKIDQSAINSLNHFIARGCDELNDLRETFLLFNYGVGFRS